MSAARLELHGSFATRADAVKRARELKRAGLERPFVRLARLKTGRRYLVLTRLEERPGRGAWWL